jgi:hypothetical protein
VPRARHGGHGTCQLRTFAQGAAQSAEALARAVRLNHPNSIGYALFFGETLTALKRGDVQAVGERATKLEAHGREHRLPQ